MTDQVVIGAGFGRTGTLSIRAALNILNVGPTYHMIETMKNNHFGKFITLMDTETRAEEEKLLRKILTENGYRSSVDFPTCLWFEEISQLSPGGKVLLSVRDSPADWVRSVKNTIFAEQMGTRTHLGRLPVIRQLAYCVPWLPFRKFDKLLKV